MNIKAPFFQKEIIFILLSVIFLAACSDSAAPSEIVQNNSPTPRPSATATSPPTGTPTQNPSYTPTTSPTSTSTEPPTATFTATPQPTLTLVPTFTPAAPNTPSESYALIDWTANEADLLAAQVKSHLIAIKDNDEFRGVHGHSAYSRHHEYLVATQKEALLRFSGAKQSESWQWQIAYNEALAYPYVEPSKAPELNRYAYLIEDALNTGNVNIENLKSWFESHEPNLELLVEESKPAPGYVSTYIVQLGETSHFLIFETEDEFKVYGLLSSLFISRMVWASHDLADLTGDGIPELILDYGRTSCCTSFHTFHIYNLTTTPPNRLKFNVASYERESLIGGSESIFTPLSIGESNNGFVLESTSGDPLFNPCDIKELATFYWNGNFFEQTEVRYEIKWSDYHNNSVCDFYRNFNASQEETNIIVDTLKDVALSGPIYPSGQYHPAVHFRLGEYHARLGNADQANQFFQKVLSYDSENADTPSPWTENAEIFLEHYHQPSDFYSTCQLSELCDLKLALKHLGETHSLVDVNAFVNALIEYGVPIKAFGKFDFDRDGNFELWVTIQEPGKQDYALWVMVNDLQGQHALYIDRIDAKNPSLGYFYQNGFSISPFVQVDPEILVHLQWLEISQTPYLTILKRSEYAPDEDETTRQYFEQTVDDLLSGRNPEDVIGALEDIQSSMVCPETFGCDKLHYNLGLAYELMGKEALAVENYLTLWNDYPESIYTIMARAKLVSEPVE
jgi:tetratricopeptide (TPR) repeat protein